MGKQSTRIWSVLMVIIMIINMLPVHAIAAEDTNTIAIETKNALEEQIIEEAYVIDEIVDKRGKYSKEFLLSNGLHMATLYADAVHYEDDGEWKDIDNTLKLSSTHSGNVYTNTANVMQVSLPESLSNSSAVSITKDGYTLSFYMSGEIRSPGVDNSVASRMTAEGAAKVHPDFVTANTATAVVEVLDKTAVLEATEFDATVLDTISSRLRYDDIFPNTDIVYDINSTQVKESIIMERYDATLQGYRYTLEVGEMIPVLTELKEIEFYDKTGEELIMLIPMPYMVDNAGEYYDGVDVSLEKVGSSYILTYLLPQEWLAEENRSWPVVLDPVVQAEATKSNIVDQNVYSSGTAAANVGVIQVGWHSNVRKSRSYLKYDKLPELSPADVIVSATIRLCKSAGSSTNKYVQVHKVTEDWEEGEMQWSNRASFNSQIEDFAICKAQDYYRWDITEIVRDWYDTGNNTGMMFKMSSDVEAAGKSDFAQFWSADYSVNQVEQKPQLYILFRNNNGLEGYWDYTSTSAGRAGTGYVNNYTGNLVWIRNDIGFGGNRMPVSVSHVYNANDNTNNTFGMGKGWRTNFNQRVYQWSKDSDYYIWEDSDGTSHYFLKESSGVYKDEDGLELTLTTTGSGTSKYKITDKYGNISHFDTNGRLTKQENNQSTKSSIDITYTTSSSKLISTITDGAGRVYTFTYSSSLLSKISYSGSGDTELSSVNFGYTDSNLTSVTDKDGKKSTFTYFSNSLLKSAQDIDGYTVNYTYNTTTKGLPNRVSTVKETDGDALGGSLTIDYAQNQTTFTDVSGNVQVVQFNNFGNTISIQDSQGRAQYAQYAINEPTDDIESAEENGYAKGNQLRLSSKLQNTVGNILDDSNFEGSTVWTAVNGATVSIVSDAAYLGSKSLKVVSPAESAAVGAAGATFSAAAGETYTFSGYIKRSSGTAYLAISDGTAIVASEMLDSGSDWTRLEVSYTATEAVTLTPQLLVAGAGTIYLDCVQVEKAPTASRYNLIENGDFRYTTRWSSSSGRTTVSGVQAPAVELDNNLYKLTGSLSGTVRITQTVKVSGKKDDTFILAGWAKGKSVPLDSYATKTREFGLLLTFNKADGSTSTTRVHFNEYVDAWQYAAAPIIAPADYTSLTVTVAYDYNANTAYFDGIQLYKEEFGTSYTYYSDGNIKTVTDLQKEETTYKYTNNDLTEATLPSGVVLTYEYDDYHNVKNASSSTGLAYSFEYDTYGNNTSVSITSGETTISSKAQYSDDGNRLLSTTDTAGKETLYDYDVNTNVLNWVQYPEDIYDETNDINTRTIYSYDEMYRLASATAATDTSSILSAQYTYENDMLTKIQTGSTTYNFAYGAFALRSDVKVGEQALASYEYTDRTNYLKALAYGNNDSVEYTYDQQGRVTQATYLHDNELAVVETSRVTYEYDNNGALATITDSATGIKTTYYYDFIDRLMKYVESGSDFNHTVGYEYDTVNNLTKLAESINGVEHTITYTYDEDNRVTTVSNGGTTEDYTYDKSGRIENKEIKQGDTTVLTESFDYRTVELTVETDEGSETQTFGTGQVSTLQHTAPDYNAEHTYTYDNNGNILSVSDGSNTTTYVYDTANQLIRENNQAANTTWAWEYDNAGNITSRKEYAYTVGSLDGLTPADTVGYTYGNTDWGDLLMAYDGQSITYDAIGNPLTDGTWTYTWQEGRQLATMTSGSTAWSFTYNNDGLRTKRTDGTTTYGYVYNGSSLSQMTVGSDTLYFAYDAGSSPMTVTYNDAVYYYVTNLQGDVIAILDSSGTTVVEYTYDAWGNILTTTGSMAATLGAHNPLRYRGYVYDTETTLYYLQSRYYDPELGRFLNADAFASTGQGILGNNMFAYCLNNPITRIDASGSAGIWYYLMVDSEWGFAHKMVEWHIKATQGQGLLFEVILKDRGRADVVHQTSGLVWEIKHAGQYPQARSIEAISQATRYIGGKYAGGNTITGLGNAGAFSGTFYINIGDSHYAVEYYTPQSGAILYTVSEKRDGIKMDAFAYTYVPHEERNANEAYSSNSAGIAAGSISIPILIPMGNIVGGPFRMPGTTYQFI